MGISIDIKGLDSLNKKRLDNSSYASRAKQSGIGNTPRAEPIPIFIQALNENIIGSKTSNAHIVLGNDRPAGLLSGHGGIGDTQSATIDIVVGRLSPVKVSKNENDEAIYTNPNFTLDAARIYISQQTDVDNNFGLVNGTLGNSKNKSAIALKADGLRFIARDGIKLITKTDANNSAGEEIFEHRGVEIIALNDDSKLQPMVLGDRTVDCLTDLIDEVNKFMNRTADFINAQQKYNDQISNHTHYSPFFGIPTLPAPTLIIQNLSTIFQKLFNHDIGFYFQMVNFGGIKTKYLGNGEDSIKSKYNKVN